MGQAKIKKNKERDIGILCTCAGVARMLRQVYSGRKHNKTIMDLTGRLDKACNEAQEAFGLTYITERMFDNLSAQLHTFNQKAIPEKGHPSIVTSLCMGMVSDVLEKEKKPERIMRWERVLSAVTQLNRYFDRDLKKMDCQEIASRALKVWNEEIGA